MNSPQGPPPLHMEAEWEVNISPQRTNIYIVHKAPD